MNQRPAAVQAARVERLTDTERKYVEKLIAAIGGRRTIRAKACWRNAQRLLLADDEKRLCYWESGLPLQHGWVTINTKVVDVTAEAATRWLKRKKIANPGELRYEYRGVIVDRNTVLEHFQRTSTWSAVLGETWWTDAAQDAEQGKADEQFRREHAEEIKAMREKLVSQRRTR